MRTESRHQMIASAVFNEACKVRGIPKLFDINKLIYNWPLARPSRCFLSNSSLSDNHMTATTIFRLDLLCVLLLFALI